MIVPGEYNTLKVLRFTSVGAYLGEDMSMPEPSVLLPNKYIRPGLQEAEEVRVFVYQDSEDRPVATTQTPLVTLGQFAMLRTKEVNRVGAFMDWGLEKDLLVPYSEQHEQMEEGEMYLVNLFWDGRTERLAGSSKISRHVEREHIDLTVGQQVNIRVFSETELGYRVLIDNRYEGLLYRNEVFSPLDIGDCTTAFIKKIRSEGKIDVSLEQQGAEGIEPNARKVLEMLNDNRGVLPLSDKSPAEEIEQQLHMSKKAFKKAIGRLYKRKLIMIEKGRIRSVVQNFSPEGPRHLRSDKP